MNMNRRGEYKRTDEQDEARNDERLNCEERRAEKLCCR
jgi:hypothetical protein